MRNAQSLNRVVGFLTVLLIILSNSGNASAYTGRLAWSPVAGATGYTVYVREDAAPYDAGMDVGALAPDADGSVRYAVANLDTEVTSHFVVVSYNAARTESVPSNELQLAYAAVAAVVDSDGDGLTDATEDRDLDRSVDAGETDRHDSDTDGDGYLDGAEVAAGTNPLDPNDPGSVTPTPTRTATPVPTPTATVTATTTPVPTTTATVTATTTPVPTTTATVTATTTPVPTTTATATPVPTTTATATTTPVPTATATPTSAACGNDQQESTEQCDGGDAASCAGLCLPDCTCAASYRFPLEGWTDDRSAGTSTVARGEPPVLVIATDQGTKFSIAYPARASLEVSMPLASFTTRTAEASSVAFSVQATNGRNYVLSYSAADGVPTTRRRTATFPLGSAVQGSAFQTTIRDLAADLRTGFGVEFAAVEQAELAGAMEVAELTLFAAGGVDVPTPATELALPLAGWHKHGSGSLELNVNDPDLDGPTLSTIPRNAERPRIAADFPDSRDALAAAFRTLSLVVRTDGAFAVEVDVRLAEGEASLAYETGTASLVARGSRLTLPLTLTPIDGSPYQLVTLDLAADVRRGLPGADLRGISNVRLRGAFQVGDVVLQDPID